MLKIIQLRTLMNKKDKNTKIIRTLKEANISVKWSARQENISGINRNETKSANKHDANV